MVTRLSAPEELDRLHDRSTAGIQDVFGDLAKAIFLRQIGRGGDLRAAIERGADLLGRTAEIANTLGRRRMLIIARGVRTFAASPRRKLIEFDDVPKVPFHEAIDDLRAREPKLAETAAEVHRIYRMERGFAMVHSAERVLTQAVQGYIARTLEDGITVDQAALDITKMSVGLGDFTRAYSETVFRTNLATIYTEGQKTMARDPDVREVVPAFRYTAVGDSDTRPDHEAADGLIAATDDPIWDVWSPPSGYNCRCSLDIVDVYDLEDDGLISPGGSVTRRYPPTWASASRDEGF